MQQIDMIDIKAKQSNCCQVFFAPRQPRGTFMSFLLFPSFLLLFGASLGVSSMPGKAARDGLGSCTRPAAPAAPAGAAPPWLHQLQPGPLRSYNYFSHQKLTAKSISSPNIISSNFSGSGVFPSWPPPCASVPALNLHCTHLVPV